MGNKNRMIHAIVANADGEIFDLEAYGAVGMDGGQWVPLTHGNAIPVPYGGEFMLLPDRRPVVFDPITNDTVVLTENPYAPGEPIFPVAVFNSPGYVNAATVAYVEQDHANPLPLFAYGAGGWFGGRFYTSAIRVDWERRQDLRCMPVEKVRQGIHQMRKRLPDNRLRAHLETCALTYGCPAGKNFFLRRFEAPLPTSRVCNARCLGCISLQQDSPIPNSQDRIGFTPKPEEIAQVALTHIQSVKRAVVSFGQGCEGDPLFAAHAIVPAIRQIRKSTTRGTINLNTNGSRPDILEQIFDAGLDSMRVSMNSVRPEYYHRYFRPTNYDFSDVMAGIDLALAKGKFVAINYLNIPGFTDTEEEIAALVDFIDHHPIHMIQWRNLNFDPLGYLNALGLGKHPPQPLGMKRMLKQIRKRFPDLKFGYFNPPKEKFRKRTDKEI